MNYKTRQIKYKVLFAIFLGLMSASQASAELYSTTFKGAATPALPAAGSSKQTQGTAAGAQAQTSETKQSKQAKQSSASSSSAFSTSAYDPTMDNHLTAPKKGEEIGMFGRKISEVERVLMRQGAKSSSYAFGKYSKMSLSVYLVTILFDKHRRVGGFLVEPKPPYKTVEPEARKYFMDLFLDGGDMSNFKVNMSNSKLELLYAP